MPFYFAMLAVLALSMLASWLVRGSKLGLALFAIRDDEDRARGLGVQTSFAKLTSFALSAGLVAMAGGVWAYYLSFIYPQFAIDPLVTIGMVLMVYLGGRGTIWGPVIGAFILVPAQKYLAYRLGASDLYLVGYSSVFLIVILLLPRGILPSLTDRAPTAAGPAGAARDADERGRRVVSALLEVDGAHKRFGGVVAVDDCTFSVEEGSITGLIGPNGSGKTTVFNLVTGYLPADSGVIRFAGTVVRRPDPTRLAAPRADPDVPAGARLPEPDGAREPRARRRRTACSERRAARVSSAERALGEQLLADFNLTRHADTLAAELSFGQRKLLEFAATLMGRPRLVLLDEPAAGVNPVLIETIERHIRRLNAEGLTFLVVEHDMPLVMRLCDPVIVLDRGRKIAEGPARQMQSDPRVLDAYLGA